MDNDKKRTPITVEGLEQRGFTLSSKVPGMYSFQSIHLISAMSKWQLCDEDGNVGKEYFDTFEQLIKRIEESINQ
jgi:hypothetical protein